VFLVYGEGKTIKARSGKILGVEPTVIAALKVKNVQGAYSVCLVAKPSVAAAIRVGDRVEPIRFKRSSKLSYPKKRPSNLEESPERKKIRDQIAALEGGRPLDNDVPTPAMDEGTYSEIPINSASVSSGAGFEWKEVEGIDRDKATDAKLIDTYPLSSRDKNTIGIRHRGAYKLYAQRKYKAAFDAFSSVASEFECNYLSSYWAGMSAVKLRSYKEAAVWFEKALAVNPDYEPAKKEREKLGDNPQNAGKKS
jgi:TolA-binding protein